MEEEQSCLLTLCFLLGRDAPAAAHTPPWTMYPPLLCIPEPAAHRQRRQEEPGSEGPEPLRHRAPAGRGKGRRALIPAPLLALRGREAGGGGRRVSSPSASQLTAPKQPFLKANCHRRSEPPPAPRPALGGGSAGVTAPPSFPPPPLLSSPAHAARRGAGGAAAGTGMQPPEPGAPARPVSPGPAPRQGGLRLGCSRSAASLPLLASGPAKFTGDFALNSSRL